jgi:hypothetical protein
MVEFLKVFFLVYSISLIGSYVLYVIGCKYFCSEMDEVFEECDNIINRNLTINIMFLLPVFNTIVFITILWCIVSSISFSDDEDDKLEE